MACGCKKELPTMPPNEESEPLMFSTQTVAAPPGEVVVQWKQPTRGRTYRHSAVTRRKLYDYSKKGPFFMLAGDAAGRFKDEIVYVADALPTP